jgi:hypothetical protein
LAFLHQFLLYSQYHANEYNAATGANIPANDNAIRLNQRRLFKLGGTSLQQYHANEYYAATGANIPADDNAIRLNQRRLFELGGAGIQQYHANDYNAATGEDIPADNDAIRLNQRRLFKLGGTGLQQYHANDYNAATGEDIPADDNAIAKNQRRLMKLGGTGLQQYHADEYNAATGEDIPANNDAIRLNRRRLLLLKMEDGTNPLVVAAKKKLEVADIPTEGMTSKEILRMEGKLKMADGTSGLCNLSAASEKARDAKSHATKNKNALKLFDTNMEKLKSFNKNGLDCLPSVKSSIDDEEKKLANWMGRTESKAQRAALVGNEWSSRWTTRESIKKEKRRMTGQPYKYTHYEKFRLRVEDNCWVEGI